MGHRHAIRAYQDLGCRSGYLAYHLVAAVIRLVDLVLEPLSTLQLLVGLLAGVFMARLEKLLIGHRLGTVSLVALFACLTGHITKRSELSPLHDRLRKELHTRCIACLVSNRVYETF